MSRILCVQSACNYNENHLSCFFVLSYVQHYEIMFYSVFNEIFTFQSAACKLATPEELRLNLLSYKHRRLKDQLTANMGTADTHCR